MSTQHASDHSLCNLVGSKFWITLEGMTCDTENSFEVYTDYADYADQSFGLPSKFKLTLGVELWLPRGSFRVGVRIRVRVRIRVGVR